jgi:hypothetical protein
MKDIEMWSLFACCQIVIELLGEAESLFVKQTSSEHMAERLVEDAAPIPRRARTSSSVVACRRETAEKVGPGIRAPQGLLESGVGLVGVGSQGPLDDVSSSGLTRSD